MMIPLLLSAASLLCESCFLFQRQRSRHGLALGLKGLASLFFFLTGLWLSLQTGSGTALVIGLGLGLVGDLLLGLRKLLPRHHDLTFVAGAVVFCIGHGFYIRHLTRTPGLWLPALPVFLILMVLSALFSHWGGFSKGKMHLPGMAYIGVEAMMCALALVLFIRQPGGASLCFALGGLSFLVSDNLLCAYSFGRLKSRAIDYLLHGTYLAAQLLIAWSLFF